MKDLIFLEQVSIFQNLTNSELKSVLYYLRDKKFNKSEVVYRQKDEPTEFYIIKSGEFSIWTDVSGINAPQRNLPYSLNLPKLKKGNQKIPLSRSYKIAILTSHGSFGEEEIISQEPRKYKVICEQAGELLYITSSDFLELLEQNGTIY